MDFKAIKTFALQEILQPQPRTLGTLCKSDIAIFGVLGSDERCKWRISPSLHTLTLGRWEHDKYQWCYQVDLDDCGSQAQVVDWMLQVSSKPWSNPAAVVHSLWIALEDIFPLRECHWNVAQCIEAYMRRPCRTPHRRDETAKQENRNAL